MGELAEAAGVLPWGAIGPAGLVTIFVLLVATGRLVPRSLHEKQVQIWERIAAQYQSAWERERATREKQAEQVDQLLVYAKTADHVLRAIKNPREKDIGG